jgi:maleate isomerase
MVRRLRLGVIVPSSNTAVEPLTSAIISSINDHNPDLDISVHYSRFRVTTIDVSPDANAQFLLEPMLTAAHLLADAAVHVIGWSGTSSGWLGFDKDEILCHAIQDATGIPATTSILALNSLLPLVSVLGNGKSTATANANANANANSPSPKKLGLVTPYVKPVNDAIRKNYASIGIHITDDRDRYLGMTKNTDFGNVTDTELDEMVSHVARHGGADVVAIYCTNLRGARRASVWEKEHDIVVLDSVATTVWGMLRTVGVQPSCVEGWGSIFSIA